MKFKTFINVSELNRLRFLVSTLLVHSHLNPQLAKTNLLSLIIEKNIYNLCKINQKPFTYELGNDWYLTSLLLRNQSGAVLWLSGKKIY